MKSSAAILLALSASTAALAEPREMAPEAQAHFDRGRALYRHGDFQAARDEFEKGREIDPVPNFAYALGNTYVKLDDCKHALREYKAYLDTHPPDDVAETVRKAMAVCAPAAEPEPEPAPAKVEPEPPPPPKPKRHHTTPRVVDSHTDHTDTDTQAPRWYADVPGGILLGAGLAGFAVGGIYLLEAENDITAANHATTVATLQNQSVTGEHERTIGTAAMVAGGTFAVVAIVRYALVSRDHRAPDRGVSLAVAPSGAYAVWSGRF